MCLRFHLCHIALNGRKDGRKNGRKDERDDVLVRTRWDLGKLIFRHGKIGPLVCASFCWLTLQK